MLYFSSCQCKGGGLEHVDRHEKSACVMVRPTNPSIFLQEPSSAKTMEGEGENENALPFWRPFDEGLMQKVWTILSS